MAEESRVTSCFSLITVPCPDLFLDWSFRESLAQAIWKFRTPYLLPTLLLFLLLLSRISKDTSVSICVSRNKDGLVCVIPVKVSNFYVWIFCSSLCSKLGNLSLYFIIFILLYLLANQTNISVVIVNLLPFGKLTKFYIARLFILSTEFPILYLFTLSILE